ncbi:MAG: hypothetical protein WBC70_17700 [Candidatus Aminicenantales bacterium]
MADEIRVALVTPEAAPLARSGELAESLLGAVKRAVAFSGANPVLWQGLMEEGLRQGYSWEETARGYARLYRRSLEIKRGG